MRRRVSARFSIRHSRGICLCGAVCPLLVERRHRALHCPPIKHWLDDAPRFEHFPAGREERMVSFHSVHEDALVRVRMFGIAETAAIAEIHEDFLRLLFESWAFGCQLYTDALIGLDPEPQ